MNRHLLASSAAALLTLAMLTPAPAAVVISQIYGGGGNSLGGYTDDFIELFNTGSSAVDLAGWSLQYAPATGAANFATQLTELEDTIDPGHYFLVQEAAGLEGAVKLPTPDATGTINLSETSGKVALVEGNTGLGCNGGQNPCSALQSNFIVDLVGYGTADFFEGSGAAPGGSATTALFRAGNGCTDTDDNAADFLTGAPDPRNRNIPTQSCPQESTPPGGTTTDPTNGVPEPLTLSIFGVGLLGAAAMRRRRAKSA